MKGNQQRVLLFSNLSSLIFYLGLRTKDFNTLLCYIKMELNLKEYNHDILKHYIRDCKYDKITMF